MVNAFNCNNAELRSLTSTANLYDFLKFKHPDSIINDQDDIRPLNDLNLIIKSNWCGAYATELRNPLTPYEVLTQIYNYSNRQALEELLPYAGDTSGLPAPSCTDNYAAYDYLCGYLCFPKFIVDRLILEGMLWNDDYGSIILTSSDYAYAEIYTPPPHGYCAPIEFSALSPNNDPTAFWFWTPKIYKVKPEYYPLLPVYVCESIIEAIALALIPGDGCPKAEVYCSIGSRTRSPRGDAVMQILESAGVTPIITSKMLHKAYPDIGYIYPHTECWVDDLNEIGWLTEDD